MNMTKFSESVAAMLRDTGFSDIALVHASPESRSFGDCEVVFNVHGFVLRFVRDRGEEFVDLASPRTPDDFHQVYDVERAMGWQPVDSGPTRPAPAPLTEVLSRLKEHFGELKEAFSAERDGATQARIKQTRDEREQAFRRAHSEPRK